VPSAALAPAFLTSELKTGIPDRLHGVLPFLVIDLVVAAVLTALGMDHAARRNWCRCRSSCCCSSRWTGWHLLVGSLLGSF